MDKSELEKLRENEPFVFRNCAKVNDYRINVELADFENVYWEKYNKVLIGVNEILFRSVLKTSVRAH